MGNLTHTDSFIAAMSSKNIDFNKYSVRVLLEAYQAYVLAPNPDNRTEYALRIFNSNKE
jgi:hypothetical protein